MIMQSDLGEDTHPTALDASVSPLDNKIYGVPWCWEIGMMYVNTDRFTEAGYDLPTEWTWDDFIPMAKELTSPPEYFALAANLTATQTTEDIIAWMWQAGSEVFAEIDGVWQVDVETAAPALQLWYDFIHVDNIVDEGSFGGANTFEGFGIGVYTMRQSGCWARQMVRDMEPEFAWNMIPLPCDERCASSSEPQTWSIGTDAVDRGTVPAAWEVVQFLCNTENEATIAYGDLLFPTRQTAMALPQFTTEEDDWALALDQLQYGIAYPKHPAWAEFDERVLGPNIQLYLQGEMEIQELIDLCTEEGTRLLQTYEM
jgi:ABC-type glycerol-3-phosphate transport system substrate-binding protein